MKCPDIRCGLVGTVVKHSWYSCAGCVHGGIHIPPRFMMFLKSESLLRFEMQYDHLEVASKS